MKLIALVLMSGFLSWAHAKETQLSLDEIKARIEVKAELYVFDGSGKKVINKYNESLLLRPRTVNGKTVIDHYWGGLYLEHIKLQFEQHWVVQDDGTISVTLEEFSREEEFTNKEGKKDTRMAGSIKKETHVLENLEQLNFVSARSTADERIVVRLTPNLNDEYLPKKLAELPVSGTDMQITDNEGNLWLQHSNLRGKFIGWTSRKGSIYLSYYPFEGAQEIGVAAGNKIEVKLGGKKVATVTSKSDFVPNDVRTTVFGVYKANKKVGENYGGYASGAWSKENELVETIGRK
jgi:hypothetical protein